MVCPPASLVISGFALLVCVIGFVIGFVIDLRIFLRNFLCIFSGIFPWIFHPTEGASGLPDNDQVNRTGKGAGCAGGRAIKNPE
ncbi:hypothetical protein EQH14_14575 [Escherichia coli]|nr:hypothetical protein [Escherichia coli]EFI5977832.1 hypothetical protein [Escherichia coli]MPQ80507.1 hypothetical protein [Escherichia coli]MPQ88957.1 hypothetical protein [Escherichia coli]MPR16699.1 hypothetical protein [Escherichia coli]